MSRRYLASRLFSDSAGKRKHDDSSLVEAELVSLEENFVNSVSFSVSGKNSQVKFFFSGEGRESARRLSRVFGSLGAYDFRNLCDS